MNNNYINPAQSSPFISDNPVSVNPFTHICALTVLGWETLLQLCYLSHKQSKFYIQAKERQVASFRPNKKDKC